QTKNAQPRYFLCLLATQAARNMLSWYNRELTALGLTAQQVMALGVLWQEDGVSLGLFAKRAGVGKAAAVTMIKRLESMGLVSRAVNPDDARLNVISLTPQAREMAPQVLEKVEKLEQSLEKALGEERIHSLLEGLEALKSLEL
ncbi:MAG: MarR family transcriptional regulator, partial [Proteobacteria bacterium]|nr:MarR family transcriptional regulator [Pseudomonadota bacterium]